MNKIPIPAGATMRMRSRGRFMYAQNKRPVIWHESPSWVIPGEPVYCLTWAASQNNFMASRVMKIEDLNK